MIEPWVCAARLDGPPRIDGRPDPMDSDFTGFTVHRNFGNARHLAIVVVNVGESKRLSVARRAPVSHSRDGLDHLSATRAPFQQFESKGERVLADLGGDLVDEGL